MERKFDTPATSFLVQQVAEEFFLFDFSLFSFFFSRSCAFACLLIACDMASSTHNKRLNNKKEINLLQDLSLTDIWVKVIGFFLTEKDIRMFVIAHFGIPRVKELISVALFNARSRVCIDKFLKVKDHLNHFKKKMEIILNKLKDGHKQFTRYSVFKGSHDTKEYLGLLLRVLDLFVMGQCGRVVSPHVSMYVASNTISSSVTGAFPGSQGDHVVEHHDEKMTVVSVNGFHYLREIAKNRVRGLIPQLMVS